MTCATIGAILVSSFFVQAGPMTVDPSTGVNVVCAPGGAPQPASATFTVTNTGATLMGWTVSTTLGMVTPTAGNLAGGASTTVTVSFQGVVSFYAGNYSGTLAFTNTGNGSGNTTRPISLTMTYVTPTTGFASSGPVGGPFAPPNTTYKIATLYGGQFGPWLIQTSQSWVSVNPSLSNFSNGFPIVYVAINYQAKFLPAGDHSAIVKFTNMSSGEGSTTRVVNLTVTTPGSAGPMTVTPSAGLTASRPAGGAFEPSSATYLVTNTGSAPMAWTATPGQSWITVTPPSGVLTAGASAPVTVKLAAESGTLPAGTHASSVSFVNATNGNGNTLREVALTVGAVASEVEANGSGSSGGSCGCIGLEALILAALLWLRRRPRRISWGGPPIRSRDRTDAGDAGMILEDDCRLRP